ncbi:MAG: RodZ domain-containing protein [Cyanobacteria bacterium P01_A01_bin.84]
MASLLNIIIIGYQEKVVKVQNDAQKQQLQEIGAYLKQIREEKSIRIEEIAAKTLIRLFCLQALEDGRFEDLPESIYVQGFIRRYGDVLGLDGNSLSQKFSDAFPKEEPKTNIEDTPVREKVSIPILPVIYIILVALASFGLFSILNPKQEVSSSSQDQNSVTTNNKTTTNKETVSKPQVSSLASAPTPKPSPTKKAEKSTVEVKLKTKERSWLEVRVDGVEKFKNILEKDKEQSWKGKKEIYIRSGNAGGILISVDGSQLESFGEVGQIKKATYTVDAETPTSEE